MVGSADGAAGESRQGGRGDGPQADRGLGGDQTETQSQLGLLVGPQEHVDCLEAPGEAGSLGLADRAAGQDDPRPRPRSLQLGEQSLTANHLGLGVLANGAGVDDDEVGLFHRGGAAATSREELARHLLRIALVHLAAQGPHEKGGQAASLRAELDQAGFDGRRGRASGPGHEGEALGPGGCLAVGHGALALRAAPSDLGAPRPSAANSPTASSSGTKSVAWAWA